MAKDRSGVHTTSAKESNPVMKKKSKTPNPSVPDGKSQKTWKEQWQDTGTGIIKPVSEEFVLTLFQEMRQWAIDNDDALKISQFWHIRRVPRTSMEMWRDKFPSCGALYKEVMEIIGNRREIGAMKRKYTESITMQSMALYDKDWRDMAEWRAALSKKNEADEAKDTIVVIERFPELPTIKDKE